MKTLPGLLALTFAMLLAGTPVYAADAAVKLKSLRGETPIDKTPEANMFKQEKDRPPIPRDFLQQPPLIPHSVRNYDITLNFNKCMDCHSWTKYKEAGATKVSLTHFKDSSGTDLVNVSPRRYFCTQCHVPQTDAAPLVNNYFQKADGLR